MTQEAKLYEMDAVRLRFMPDGGPMEGILSVEFPEQEPFTQHLSLAKPRSRNLYAKAAAQHNGIDSELLEKLLVDLCSARFEEVEAAQQTVRGAAEEPEECPQEVSEEEVEALVGRPGVLSRFVEDAATIQGVVGEREPLKLLTLNAFGAQLALQPNGKPLGSNVVLTAEWGRGKNHLCDAVATLLPEEFYLPFESASAKSLYYRAQEDPKILAHKWLYLNEAEAMDQLVEMLRPLLSGGKASHLTVNQVDGQNAAQELTVEGPVTITIPTIRNTLDRQLQSRLLTADLPDYEGRVASHSRAASKLLLPGYANENYSPRIRHWRAALRSLTAVRRVVFPLDHEGFCFDRDDVSHGARLWTNLLGLQSTHAMLERRNREEMKLPNGERAIVATPADYEVAYNVFKATCERSVQNLSETHRKILNGLYELTKKDNKRHWSDRKQGWSQRAIERHTGVSQSTISAQRSFLTKSLKLVLEDNKGRLRLAEDVDPSLWETDDALDGFPRPAQVSAWWNGDDDPPDPERPER